MKTISELIEELHKWDMDLYYDIKSGMSAIKMVLDAIANRDWYVALSHIRHFGKWQAVIITGDDEDQVHTSGYSESPLWVLLDVYLVAVKPEWTREEYDPECECECCSASVRYDPEVDGVCDEPDDETDRITGIEEQLTSIDRRLARLESMLTRDPVAVHLQYTAG
jgi:hypothetical protein